MIIRPVLADEVPAVWPEIKPLVASACRYSEGTQTPEDIYRRVTTESNSCLFLVGDYGVSVWEKDGDWLHVTSTAGQGILEKMDTLMRELVFYALLLGCRGLSFRGRRGWDRVMRKYGFVHVDNEMRAIL
jgi:hypothetical protein